MPPPVHETLGVLVVSTGQVPEPLACLELLQADDASPVNGLRGQLCGMLLVNVLQRLGDSLLFVRFDQQSPKRLTIANRNKQE